MEDEKFHYGTWCNGLSYKQRLKYGVPVYLAIVLTCFVGVYILGGILLAR